MRLFKQDRNMQGGVLMVCAGATFRTYLTFYAQWDTRLKRQCWKLKNDWGTMTCIILGGTIGGGEIREP
jgi:hypothetical protein